MTELRLRSDHLSWRELDGEIVALDGEQSLYLATNRAGTLLWRRIAEGASRDQLVDEVVAEFGVDGEQAAADVDRFITDLRANGLLAP
jgi:hypothetical protein